MPEELTIEKTKEETQKHIDQVAGYLALVIGELHKRMNDHDKSKFEDPEIDSFAKYTSQLERLTYGSDEYKESLKKMQPAIDHHYSKNRHHPEFHKNGIDNMTLMDIMEMTCDWLAATKRHSDGSIEKSLEINKERFNINPQLIKILKNTVESLENVDYLKKEK